MIVIKNAREIEKMRESNRIIAEVLDAMATLVRPGISAWDLNQRAEKIIAQEGATPSFKGYQVDGLEPYPYGICASINDEIVHGFSLKKKIIHDGDIISIDVGTRKNGFCGDGARTFPVGKIDKELQQLLDVTQLALQRAIEQCIVGNRIGDISAVIEKTAMEYGYFVVDGLTGHGIGRGLHEDPMVPNEGRKHRGPRLVAGMTLSIEPMFAIGTSDTIDNGWAFSTADGSPSAHFEHTVLITAKGPEILTQKGSTAWRKLV